MKIALFGGAFDPPHKGHQLVANSLVEKGVVDEVWFVPVYKHPWADRYDKKELTSYHTRSLMLDKMVTDKAQRVVHFIDVSFTYPTLLYFQDQYLSDEFSWVMGSEYLSRFDDFLAGHPKLLDFHFYIYPRAGYPFEEKYHQKNMTFLTKMPEISISSTLIKQKVKQQKNIDNLVIEEVANLIKEYELYR